MTTTNQNMPKIYLSQSELFNAIIDSRIKGRVTEELGGMFMKLAKRYTNHRYFVRYHHLHDDLQAIGATACCSACFKFHPFKDLDREWDEATPIEYDHNVCNNAFAYMTTCIHNAFLQYLKKEYDHINVQNKAKIQEGLDPSFGYIEMMEDKAAQEATEANLANDGEGTGVPERVASQSVWDGYEN